jgi:hypothetical protein
MTLYSPRPEISHVFILPNILTIVVREVLGGGGDYEQLVEMFQQYLWQAWLALICLSSGIIDSRNTRDAFNMDLRLCDILTVTKDVESMPWIITLTFMAF